MKRILFTMMFVTLVISANAQRLRVGELSSGMTDSLFRDTLQLGEVVVKGTLPKTHVKGEALVTRIAGTTLEHTGTTMDMLDRLPQVNADGTNVSVVGRGTAAIYINGREVTDMNELTRLQSDEISRVEVVQNPGARYSASTRAVIRIYKKRAQGEGFSLDNQTSYMYQYGPYVMNNLQMNYRHDGLDIGTGVYAGLGMTGKSNEVAQNTYLQQLWTQNNDVKIRARNKFVSPTFTLNYQPNDHQSLGLRYNYSRNPKQDMKGSCLITDILLDGQPYEHSYSKVSPAYHNWDHSLNAYYSGLSKGWQIDVNADLYIKGGGLDDDTDEQVTSYNGGQTTTALVDTRNRTRDNLYAVKATAAHELFGGQMLFGTEDSYTHRKTAYSNPQHIVNDNETKINETMLAGFMEYERMIGKLSLSVGLRFEHINNDYFLYEVRQPEQSKCYNDWFPSVSLGFPVGEIGGAPVQVMASYSHDIARPGYEKLRSNVFYDNKYTLEGGNPNLDPQYSQSFVLNAAWRWLNLSAGYEHIKNELTIFSEPFSAEHPEVSFLHPIEQDPYNAWNVGLDVRPTITLFSKATWTPQASFYLRGQDYKAETKDGLKLMNHPMFSLKLQNQLVLPHQWTVEVAYGFQSRGHYGNMAMTETKHQFGMRLRKSWLNERLEARLSVSDIFNQNAQRSITYNGIREIEETAIPYRSISVTLRYRQNAVRSKYRGQSAGESQKNRM